MKIFNERGSLVLDLEVTKMENLISGIDASKSVSPAIGRVYIATDTSILYICFVTGVWSQVAKIKNLVFGTDIAKPGSPAVGDVYVATDVAAFYACYSAGNWTQVGGAAESAYFSKRVAYTLFNSLDFLDTAPAVTLHVSLGLKVEHTGAADAIARILRENTAGKSLKFAADCLFPGSGDSMAFMGMGGHPLQDSFPHIGFYADNWPDDGKIWASNGTGGGGGTQVRTEITGYTITNFNHYKAVYIAGSKIEFYVNGNLEVTHTTHLPIISMPVGRFMVGTAVGTMYTLWYAYEEEL